MFTEPKTMFYRVVPSSGGFLSQTWGADLLRDVAGPFESEVEAEDYARSTTPDGYYFERVW